MKKLLVLLGLVPIFVVGVSSEAFAKNRWPWFLPPLPPVPPVVVAPAPVPVQAPDYYYDNRVYQRHQYELGYSDGYRDGYNLARAGYLNGNTNYMTGYRQGWLKGRDQRQRDEEPRFGSGHNGYRGHHGWRDRDDD